MLLLPYAFTEMEDAGSCTAGVFGGLDAVDLPGHLDWRALPA